MMCANNQVRRRGFSLLEIAIALTIMGLLVGGTMQIATMVASKKQLDVTRQHLDAVEKALVRYATRHGRLPCPRDASAMEVTWRGNDHLVAGFGVGDVQIAKGPCQNKNPPDWCEYVDTDPGSVTYEVPQGSDPSEDDNFNGGSCKRDESYRGVPYRELGIQKNMTLDGWNRQITYVVYDGDGGIYDDAGISGTTGENGVNLYDLALDHPKNDDNKLTKNEYKEYLSGSKSPKLLVDAGLRVRSNSDTPEEYSHDPNKGNGAAFVLISHGPNGVGAYTRSGSQIGADGVPFGDDEEINRDNAEDFADSEADSSTPFFDLARNDSDDSSHYDDTVRAMSIHELARRAGWTPFAGR